MGTTYENSCVMTFKDSSSNLYKMYPVTKKSNVVGFDDAIRNQAVTSAGSGAVYTATVAGITSLSAGVSFVMIPHTVSTTSSPKLNVNSLGEKLIQRRVSNCTGTFYNASAPNDWLTAGKPVTMTYDGQYWIADLPVPNANDIMGTIPIANGGTGATTVAAARNALGLGNTSGAVPIANGGTGATTVAAARNALGLGNTSGAVPIANGGTGATTVAAARNALGLGNTSGAVPIANGGTGATSASDARSKLGAASRVSYTATITTTWSGSGPYTQAVSVSGILSTDTPHIMPAYSTTNSTAISQKEAWACVSKAETSANTITFTCFEEKPTTAIPIQIEVMR